MYISAMTNQQLMDNGHQMMDETDQAIERSKKVGIFFFLLNNITLRIV